MNMPISTTTARYIQLDAPETANLPDEKTLLPLTVYQALAKFIDDALKTVGEIGGGAKVNDVRRHNAISIDGERGTGKTSVLVNLSKYLASANKETLANIHILEPVDPTLLEDHESLFLHVIVAAVLSDDDVKKAQSINPDGYKHLNQALEKLAHALECVQAQKEQRGMDKLRALFGNKYLADRVQDFFKAALQLLGKKLLVLPIDDVDTSLNRAFENLEIVRRYLTTPYVLPILSGDRELYREVTWRDFHGRLTHDSTFRSEDAYDKATDLANEYQRKVLPLPRRLVMPPIGKYLNDRNISITRDQLAIISLPNFHTWLLIFLTGPVNGRESSDLPLPIPSVRALTQLVNHCSDLIPHLPQSIRSAKDTLDVRRAWQMPTIPTDVIRDFNSSHQKLSSVKKREYGHAYRQFSQQLSGQERPLNSDALDQDAIASWERTLSDYFQYEPQAGEVYLVLQAYMHWQTLTVGSDVENKSSIFNTPLFQPLQHDASTLAQFDKASDLVDWQERLKEKLPASWLSKLLNQKTILPYPVAQVGVNTSRNWKYWDEITEAQVGSEARDKAIFLVSLLTQHNYYTNAKRSMMLNIGRVFELLINSLIGPVSIQDLQRIVQDAPFHSTSALAPTKTLTLSLEKGDGDDPLESGVDDVQDLLNAQLLQLQEEISEWRDQHHIDQVRFSPWMVYKVFNKVYSQVASSEHFPKGMTEIGAALNMVGMVFYATWSAFGSFEKGRLFGLTDEVATVNLNSAQNFEQNDHFRVNVLPFAPTTRQQSEKTQEFEDKKSFGESTRTGSYFLADHPIRRWLTSIPVADSAKSKREKKEVFIAMPTGISEAKKWLLAELNLDSISRLTPRALSTELSKKGEDECQLIVDKMTAKFPNANELKLLKKAHDELRLK